MRRGLRLTTALAVVLLGMSSPAQAQTRAPALEGGRVPGWVFTPAMGMGGAWDDNVLLVNPADRPEPDYASPVSPSFSLDYTGRRTLFSSGYSGSWVFYRTLNDLNSFDQSLRTSVQHRVTSRTTFFGQGNVTVAPSTDAVLLAGVPFQRIGTRTSTVRSGVEVALSARSSVRTNYALNSVAFDRDRGVGRDLQGGHAHEVVVAGSRALSARLSLGGEYAFTRAVVSAGPDPDALGDDRFNIQRGSMTAAYRLSPTVAVSGSVGVAQLGRGLTHDSKTGPTWGLGATRRGRLAVVSANYQRSYVPSFGFGGTFQNEELTGSVHVPFARRRAYVESNLSWLENDSLAPGDPRLRTIALGSVLGYRATRWLNAEAYYVRSQQDTRRPGGQLSRNQIGFRFVAARPMRLR